MPRLRTEAQVRAERKYRQRNREKIQQYQTRYFRENPELKRKANNDWRIRHPEKISAEKKLQRAVLSGSVQKLPCAVCNSLDSVGHHPDYTKPLEVIWVCRTHHMDFHKQVVPQ